MINITDVTITSVQILLSDIKSMKNEYEIHSVARLLGTPS